MKTLLLLLIALALSPGLSQGQESSPQLPASIKTTLDRSFPGWKFARVNDDIRKFLKENVSSDARPNIIEGDFDGNGKQDYALLIAHGKTRNKQGVFIGSNTRLLVFLSGKTGYKLHRLPEPGDYLTLGKKGAKSYDFEADKTFRYDNDAIEVWVFEKAGWVYIYDKGKFRSVYIAD